MTIAISPQKTYNAEEYLALEIESDTRSEYRNGEIIPMTGGTPNHNELIGSFIVLLRLALKGQPYNVFVTDQRLWIPEHNLYTYPDAMVIPRPIELQSGRNDTVTNPLFIGEVLSKSTKDYDRGDKFAAYRTLATLQEYLLIDQYQPRVEQFVRQNPNQWLFTEYKGKAAKFTLASLTVEISLGELYENIEF
jgi:Uma2 family endonuclease